MRTGKVSPLTQSVPSCVQLAALDWAFARLQRQGDARRFDRHLQVFRCLLSAADKDLCACPVLSFRGTSSTNR